MTTPKTKKLTANTIDYTSGGHYKAFTNLNNAKKIDNTYAECRVDGKKSTQNRPSTLTFKNLKAQLPTGARVHTIEVTLKHSKAKVNNKDCNVTSPNISLMKGDKVLRNSTNEAQTRKAQAPTNTATKNVVTFNIQQNYDVINNSNFGVKIDYPTNANNNQGDIRIYYVQIKITYVTASFPLTISKGEGQYNGDDFEINYKISNKNHVFYNPTVTIIAPSGMSLKSYDGGGTLVKTQNQVWTWTPKLGRKSYGDELHMVFTAGISFPSGVETKTVTFTGVLSLGSVETTYNVTIGKTRPIDPEVDPDPSQTPSYYDNTSNSPPSVKPCLKDEPFSYAFEIDDGTWDTLIKTIYDYGKDQEWWGGSLEQVYDTIVDKFVLVFTGSESTPTASGPISKNQHFNDTRVFKKLSALEADDKKWTLDLHPVSVGYDEIYGVLASSTYQYPPVTMTTWKFSVNPPESDLSTPSVSILTLGQEELNRLGHTYNYTVQTNLKENTSETYVRDWYKNFRIGVFNNGIKENIHRVSYVDEETGETVEIVADTTDYESLSVNDIVQYAEYWSEPPTTVNTFTNLECEFPYNKDYPLYILIVGDYSEATTPATITYTEPCIVEDDYYKSRVPNGVYPVPIDDLVLNDGSTSDITINALSNSDTIVFYDLPLEDDFGTNEEIAIRGIQLNGNVESNTDNLILNASLVNSKNESKNRSIVLGQLNATLNADNQFSIGQVGDLWGFSTQDIKELEDWEIHLTLNNSVNDYDAQCNFGNINLGIYIETIETQNIKCYIEGEDLSYYGVFIQDVKIPEGLKTDTDYINVNGTDVNDPYRQNIREKTMEIQFDIGDNCDLEGATLSLRQLAKLLVNERDAYNKPVPKRIEFSHYPDVYWEYIMEDTLDNEIEISSYTVKAKLVVPAGTSYDKEPTVTSSTGYISGLAHIRPNIIFKPTSDIATLKENYTGQEFHIQYKDTSWIGKYIEIDCDNRIVWLKEDDDDTEGINITSYVDWNSDWFTLHGEYEFDSIGCAILSVTWEERW